MAVAIKTLKIINKIISFSAAAATITIAIIFILQNILNLLNLVRTIYMMTFAVTLIIAQFGFQFFLRYFNFLQGSLGRGLFIIFLGTIQLSGVVYSVVIGFIVMFAGILYIIIGRKINKQTKRFDSSSSGQKQQNKNEKKQSV